MSRICHVDIFFPSARKQKIYLNYASHLQKSKVFLHQIIQEQGPGDFYTHLAVSEAISLFVFLLYPVIQAIQVILSSVGIDLASTQIAPLISRSSPLV